MRPKQAITFAQLETRRQVWTRYRQKFPKPGQLPRLVGIDSRKASCIHTEGSGLQNLNPAEVLKLQALDPLLATPDDLVVFASMREWPGLLPLLQAAEAAAKSGTKTTRHKLPQPKPFDMRMVIAGMVIDCGLPSIESLLERLNLTTNIVMAVVNGTRALPQESCLPFFEAAILRLSPVEMLSVTPTETAHLLYPQYLAARNDDFDELRYLAYREAAPVVPLMENTSEIFYEICAAMNIWGLGPLAVALGAHKAVPKNVRRGELFQLAAIVEAYEVTGTTLKNVRRGKHGFQHQLGVPLVTLTQGRIPTLRLLAILPEKYRQALWGPMRWEEMRLTKELGPRPPVGIDWSEKPNPTVRLSNFARESILSGIRETLGAKASRWVKSVEEAFHPISESAAIFFVRTGPADLNLRNFLHFISSTRHEILYPVLLYLQRERNGGKPPVVEAPPAADETDD